MTDEIANLRCTIAGLIAENERLKEALEKIATRKMSAYLSLRDMNEDFIKIAKEALRCVNLKSQ